MICNSPESSLTRLSPCEFAAAPSSPKVIVFFAAVDLRAPKSFRRARLENTPLLSLSHVRSHTQHTTHTHTQLDNSFVPSSVFNEIICFRQLKNDEIPLSLLPSPPCLPRCLFLLRILGTQSAVLNFACLLYTSPSPRDLSTSRMPSSA